MEVSFKKISKEGSTFSLLKNDIKFFGNVLCKSSILVSCKGKIEGNLLHICDRCGKDILLHVSENIDLLISDGVYKSEEKEIDIIEFYDGFINFDEIFESEIEAIKSDYHYCDDCLKNKQGE